MADRVTAGGISVHAIPGTRTVLLAMDADAQARRGLLGFSIGTRRRSGSIAWRRGFKFFEELVPSPQPGERRSLLDHPWQSFLWGDYSSPPGGKVTYVVRPMRGTPRAPDYGPDVDITVRLHAPDEGNQGLYFNRGAIPSQAFADEFGNVGPTEDEQNDPGNDKVQWLSRGLLEGALAFIAQSNGPRFQLLVAAYEFQYRPILEALKIAAGTKAKVRIVYDGGDRKRDGSIAPTDTSTANSEAIAAARLGRTRNVELLPRTRYSGITHNKFIVLVENDVPVQVWTGSTNFTPSGFLGQSNVAHVVRSPDVARAYASYWEALAADPTTPSFKTKVMALSPDPPAEGLSADYTPVFSPRRAGMMAWYADRLGAAGSSVMFTAAFGVDEQLAERFAEDRDFLRFVLMERRDRNPQEQALLERDRDTAIALGEKLNSDTIRLKIDGHALDEWFRQEEHFRTKGNIFYIHTKYMLIDPLSEDPQIFSGSANFSNNSVESNDENMLLLRRNAAKDVAPIYVNEFSRLFNHLYFRTVAVKLAEAGETRTDVAFLDPTDAWVKPHFRSGTLHDKRRRLFR
jgi:phosphatidylserine/phosphatidylglycerophosphate/cardiolipin synthase-like enzyme